MANFEQLGQTIDREVERLRRYIEGEVKPATERKVVAALRATSRRLAKLARKLERSAAEPGRKKN